MYVGHGTLSFTFRLLHALRTHAGTSSGRWDPEVKVKTVITHKVKVKYTLDPEDTQFSPDIDGG